MKLSLLKLLTKLKLKLKLKFGNRKESTSLAAPGHSLTPCNASPPAKFKMAARGPKNGRRGLERGLTLGYCILHYE